MENFEKIPPGLVGSGKTLSGAKNGIWKYTDGFSSHEIYLISYENGERHGLFSIYGSKRKPLITGEYIFGQKTGKWKFYHEDGSISMEGGYTENYQHGEWKYYHQDGGYTLAVFVDGYRTGLWTRFTADGTIDEEIRYFNDIRL